MFLKKHTSSQCRQNFRFWVFYLAYRLKENFWDKDFLVGLWPFECLLKPYTLNMPMLEKKKKRKREKPLTAGMRPESVWFLAVYSQYLMDFTLKKIKSKSNTALMHVSWCPMQSEVYTCPLGYVGLQSTLLVKGNSESSYQRGNCLQRRASFDGEGRGNWLSSTLQKKQNKKSRERGEEKKTTSDMAVMKQ